MQKRDGGKYIYCSKLLNRTGYGKIQTLNLKTHFIYVFIIETKIFEYLMLFNHHF